MTVAFQRMFGILERWNNNQVTPSLSKPYELSYRSNTKTGHSKPIRKKACILFDEKRLKINLTLSELIWGINPKESKLIQGWNDSYWKSSLDKSELGLIRIGNLFRIGSDPFGFLLWIESD